MVFISPLVLWALLAAVVPILIHLINRWRHKSMRWAAIDFIIKVSKERRGRKKLIHYLILSLRVLAITVVVTAMARPFLSNVMGWGLSEPDEVVLIADRSSSMSAKPDQSTPLRQSGISLAATTMESFDQTSMVLIDSASKKPLHVTSPELLPELSVSSATDTATDYPELLSLAIKQLSNSSGGKNELWIASDMQLSDWNVDSPRWKSVKTDLLSLPKLPFVRILALRDRPAFNRGVSIDRVVSENGRLKLDFTISREGAQSSADEILPVTVSINNSPVVADIPLSGEKNRLSRYFDLPEGKSEGFGFISIPHDDSPGDDRFFFTFSKAQPATTLVVSRDRPIAELLQNMAAPPGMEGRKSEYAPSGKLPDLSPYSLVIWQEGLPKGDVSEKIAQYVENGGCVIFMPGLANGPNGANGATSGFLGVEWDEEETAPNNEFFNISTWNHKIGPLRDGTGDHAIPLNSVKALKRYALGGQAEAIAAWNDGKTAIVRKPHGKGEACFLSTIPDYSWSNLADGHALIPLIQRLAEQGYQRHASRNSLDVGDALLSALPVDSFSRVDVYASKESSVPNTASPLTTAGCYVLDGRFFAFNRPASEDDPEQISDERIRTLLPGVEILGFSGEDSYSSTQDMWRFFLILSLLFLLAEAVLCMPSGNQKPKTPL